MKPMHVHMKKVCLGQSMFNQKAVDQYIQKVEDSITSNLEFDKKEKVLVGVDLGTAYIVLVVLDQDFNPIACEMEFANVIRDGLVLDYLGAVKIVRKLKEKLEERLGIELHEAAISIPPGTGDKTTKTHQYVIESAGMEVTTILDEPTAANMVLQIDNGVVVDIGGGTTGLSVLENSQVVYTADEATGGTHLTLVLAGSYKISIEEAEILKKDKARQQEIFPAVLPVLQKMASIVRQHIEGRHIESIYLVGGTCCIQGIEKVFEKEIGIKTYKPANPFLVTPAGIAQSSKVRR